jgi:hypothetical protein
MDLCSEKLSSRSGSVMTTFVEWTGHFISPCFDFLNGKVIIITLALLNWECSSRGPSEVDQGECDDCPGSLSRDNTFISIPSKPQWLLTDLHTPEKNEFLLKWK